MKSRMSLSGTSMIDNVFFTIFLRYLKSLALGAFKWLAMCLVSRFCAIWAILTLQIGDTASWRGDNFLVLEKRRAGLGYEHKIVNLKGINPWTLPLLTSNPALARHAQVFWYRGRNLKKTGHPELRLKLSL
jgi:hypothetical protein